MASNCDLPSSVVDQIRRNPIHQILVDLGRSALEMNLHATVEFRKLVAYVLELADGRDRREPWTTKPGVARPVPRVRIALEKCFGDYADLQWFRLNKTANTSGMPLIGLFPRAAASLSRVGPEDFGAIVEALVSDQPEAAIMRLLHRRSGKVRGLGVELFSRLGHAFRRDVFFVIPREWGDDSGCLRFIGNDLRKYGSVCRTLRSVCDQVGIDQDIRSSILARGLEAEVMDDALHKTLHRAIGPTLAQFAILAPEDAYVPRSPRDDQAAMPLEFAANSILRRRGERRLRTKLVELYGGRCAISGDCPVDLLEVAYLVPFPDGDVHAPANAILLRADLHTLWDLNLIAIDPETMSLRIAPRLEDSIYQNIVGRKLGHRADQARLSIEGLRERWTAFAGAPASSSREAKPARGERSGARRPGDDAARASVEVPGREESKAVR